MSIVPNPPRATVRLQFHRGFTLENARATVPYYAALGISHVYASPLLAARAGSSHGYDVIDPTRINPELGGLDALRRLVTALRAHGMGLILDIVPNHMAASVENPWWREVLEWGRDSRHATTFDIDWETPDPELHGRVLLPVLERPLDAILTGGDIVLRHDRDDGRIDVAIGAQRFPLAGSAYAQVLCASGLTALAREFAMATASPQFERALAALRECAQTATGHEAINHALAQFSPASAAGRERLQALLACQPYLLAPWSQAWRRINWRRFFDINDLVAIRPDRTEVFDAAHVLVLDLYAQGLIDGLRIDHVDGLVDPGGYCWRLRERLAALESRRPPDAPCGPAYLIVEKILAPDEALRADWPVDGTTGYEFMDQVGAVLHDQAGEVPLARLWQEATGPGDFATHALAARRQMTLQNFSADLDAALRALQALAAATGEAVDAGELRAALVELIVHFPVYRTYAKPGEADLRDAQVLASAARAADSSTASHDRRTMALLQRWLGGDMPADARDEAALAIARFQALTPPVAAKAIEDTAFYRYGRLLSRNEVGADPDHFALSVQAFHAACERRRRDTPHTLLATATHDHKRGEDARARLAVLSEMPGAWAEQVHRWRRINAKRLGTIDGKPAPDPPDQSMLYQSIVGAWPLQMRTTDGEAVRKFTERVGQWQRKALREAKRRSSWSQPDDGYETACAEFLQACMSSSDFLDAVSGFVAMIAPAGALNGLSQTLLRLTTPGVPDLYQGTEFWDFSLVDPDNRRPVDLAARETALHNPQAIADLLAGWTDGHLKQQLIARALQARQQCPVLFRDGSYRPLTLHGTQAERAIAFQREHGADTAVVIAPRLPWPLLGADARTPHIVGQRWHDTAIDLPAGDWCDIVCRRERRFAGRTPLQDVLDRGPVALLLKSAE